MSRREQDRRIFEELIKFLDEKKPPAKHPGRLILEIGKFFLETPYVSGTLETKRAEHLIVTLREYDCFTFVENAVALARHVKSGGRSFEVFRKLLRKIRYRQGRLQGYSSRLHYFSDWIHDNEKKGILKDVTGEIGGRPFRKPVNFMTTYPNFYPPLKNPVIFSGMKSAERRISKRSLFFIPKNLLRSLEDRIQDGDLIAITTHTEGLDVQHVGLAERLGNRIHLLHASGRAGRVVLSRETLYRYLMRSRGRSGIMIARPY